MMSKGKNINEWLAPIQKGSNKIRNLISGRGSRQYRNFMFDKIKPIKSLWEKLNIEMDEGLIKCNMMVWDIKEVDTDFRQSAFRWYQGMIHGNTVISHFGDVDRKCTFCKITIENQRRIELGWDLTEGERDGLIIPDEDRPHLFWDCDTVRNCINGVNQAYWGRILLTDKKNHLMGKDMVTMEATLLYMLINMFVKYRIWKYKLAGVLPNTQYITNDLRNFINGITSHNKWRIMLPLVRQQVLA
jgi:hypothetical protein